MNPPTSTPPSSDVAAVRTRAWRDRTLIAQDVPVTDVSEHLHVHHRDWL
jgi:ferric-dicitrate binding protein FerR (iron transport regulator)